MTIESINPYKDYCLPSEEPVSKTVAFSQPAILQSIICLAIYIMAAIALDLYNQANRHRYM